MVFNDPNSYSEAGINLNSILMIQGVRTRLPENPLMMQDNSPLPLRKMSVNATLDHIEISLRGEILISLMRSPDDTDRDWNSKRDHLRHDYVASMLQDNTDMKLSDLGIQSPLTPDKISKDGKVVLELATTISMRENKPEQDYNKKILNYRDVCLQNNLRLTILCVSGSFVYTNCHLRFDMVSELCRRLREAASFETEISKQSGYTPNSVQEDGDEDLKKVKECMIKLEKIKKLQSWDFNCDLEDLSLSPQTEEDRKEASRIMTQSWKDAAKLKKKLPHDSLEKYLSSLKLKETRADKKEFFLSLVYFQNTQVRLP